MKFKSRKKEQFFWGYLFLAFPLLLLTVFVFFPIGFAFVVSFFDWNMLIPDKPFVGLGNYIELFQDPVFIKAIKKYHNLYFRCCASTDFAIAVLGIYHEPKNSRTGLFSNRLLYSRNNLFGCDFNHLCLDLQ